METTLTTPMPLVPMAPPIAKLSGATRCKQIGKPKVHGTLAEKSPSGQQALTRFWTMDGRCEDWLSSLGCVHFTEARRDRMRTMKETKSTQAVACTPTRLYARRIVGGDVDHRRIDRFAVARRAGRTGNGAPNQLHEQLEAGRLGGPQLRVVVQDDAQRRRGNGLQPKPAEDVVRHPLGFSRSSCRTSSRRRCIRRLT